MAEKKPQTDTETAASLENPTKNEQILLNQGVSVAQIQHWRNRDVVLVRPKVGKESVVLVLKPISGAEYVAMQTQISQDAQSGNASNLTMYDFEKKVCLKGVVYPTNTELSAFLDNYGLVAKAISDKIITMSGGGDMNEMLLEN